VTQPGSRATARDGDKAGYFLRFAGWVIHMPAIAWLLILVNLASAVAGYLYWYGGALSRAPLYVWPFVPDSPLAVTLMAGAILSFHYRRAIEFLGLVAAGACIKYGVWTDFVWFTNSLSGGGYPFDAVLMSLTHFGMIIEGLIIMRFLRFRPLPVVLASLFLAVNDFVDYALGYHPSVPNPQDLDLIMPFSVGTTAVIVLFWLSAAWFRGRADNSMITPVAPSRH